MPKFISRKGGGDLLTNPYYNSQEWLGVKADNRSYSKQIDNYQCVYWAFERSQEIAEARITKFENELKDFDIEYPLFDLGFPSAKFFWEGYWDKTELGSEARLGDIVVYGDTWGSGCGHVRIIEKMDNDYFYCSGANEGGTPVSFNIKIQKLNAGQNGLLGYVHNPYITYEEEKEVIDYEQKYNEVVKELKNLASKY